MNQTIKRRSLLKGVGGVLSLPFLQHQIPASDKPGRVLRVAHITDVHLKNELDAPRKFVKCLHHIQNQSPKVDLVINWRRYCF